MKTILATTLLLASSAAFAHNSTNDCEVDIHAGVSIAQHKIEFFKQGSDHKKGKSLYSIVDDNNLFINGTKVSLTASQQSLVHEYSTSIRAVVPEVKSIAIDGINLAMEGVSIAFGELLGGDNELTKDLVSELTKIRNEVDSRFDGQKAIYVDKDGFDGEEFFDKEFEQRIESAVEKAVINSMGSLLVIMGQEMLLSGGQGNSLETRMKDFGENLANEMEIRTEKVKRKTDTLCLPIVNIDQLEEQLKTSISSLASINVISVSLNKK